VDTDGADTTPAPIDGLGSAIVAIVAGLFFEAIVVLVFVVAGTSLRRVRRGGGRRAGRAG
jgi:hypothetical protein